MLKEQNEQDFDDYLRPNKNKIRNTKKRNSKINMLKQQFKENKSTKEFDDEEEDEWITESDNSDKTSS